LGASQVHSRTSARASPADGLSLTVVAVGSALTLGDGLETTEFAGCKAQSQHEPDAQCGGSG
jgi:hypothetical protein